MNFQEKIKFNWPDHVIAPGVSKECGECFFGLCAEDIAALTEEESQAWEEGSFSWSSCDSCDSGLGGTRYPAHAIHREAFGPDAKRPNDVTHIDICGDCLCFHANGDLPQTEV